MNGSSTDRSCKDCPARRPGCHDGCSRYRAWKARREAQREYTRRMNCAGTVYRTDYEDKHRQRGKKKYLGKNGGDRGCT